MTGEWAAQAANDSQTIQRRIIVQAALEAGTLSPEGHESLYTQKNGHYVVNPDLDAEALKDPYFDLDLDEGTYESGWQSGFNGRDHDRVGGSGGWLDEKSAKSNLYGSTADTWEEDKEKHYTNDYTGPESDADPYNADPSKNDDYDQLGVQVRRSMMRRTLAGCAAFLALLGLVGCDDSDPQPRPSPSRTTTTPPPDVPTTGPADSSITWELGDGATAKDPPVAALQRYIAFDTYITSLPEDQRDGDDAAALASGYGALATGEQATRSSTPPRATTRCTKDGTPADRPERSTTRRQPGAARRLHRRTLHLVVGKAPDDDQKPSVTLYTLRSTGGDWKVSLRRSAAPRAIWLAADPGTSPANPVTSAPIGSRT